MEEWALLRGQLAAEGSDSVDVGLSPLLAVGSDCTAVPVQRAPFAVEACRVLQHDAENPVRGLVRAPEAPEVGPTTWACP